MNVNMQVSKQIAGYVCISVQDFGSRLSVCASVSLSKCPSVTLLVCQIVGESVGLSTCWPVCLSVCSLRWSVHLFLFLPIHTQILVVIVVF